MSEAMASEQKKQADHTERWTLVEERQVRTGYRAIVSRTFRLPSGEMAEFEIKQESACVCALALTPRDTILLTRQFRPGPNALLLELPGGGVEANETPEQAMRRELLEETGYAGQMHYVGLCFDCAYSTRVKHSFAITGCERVAEPHPDALESIEVVELCLPDFRAYLRSGALTDVETGYRALDYLGLL